MTKPGNSGGQNPERDFLTEGSGKLFKIRLEVRRYKHFEKPLLRVGRADNSHAVVGLDDEIRICYVAFLCLYLENE